jgi:hypothetical protein
VDQQTTTSAPAANTTLMSVTGLNAGQYELLVQVGSDDTAGIGKYFLVVHANQAGTTFFHQLLIPVPTTKGEFRLPRFTVNANDQIFVNSGTVAAGAGSTYTVNVYLRPALSIALWWSQYIDVDDSVDIRDAVTRTAGQDFLNFADGDELRIPSGSNNRYVVVFVTELAKGLANQYKRAFLLRHSVDWTNPSNI